MRNLPIGLQESFVAGKNFANSIIHLSLRIQTNCRSSYDGFQPSTAFFLKMTQKTPKKGP